MSVALLRWFVLEAFRDQQAGLSEDKADLEDGQER